MELALARTGAVESDLKEGHTGRKPVDVLEEQIRKQKLGDSDEDDW